jgi:hypothetical protein
MLEGEDFFRSSGLIDVPDERGIVFHFFSFFCICLLGPIDLQDERGISFFFFPSFFPLFYLFIWCCLTLLSVF